MPAFRTYFPVNGIRTDIIVTPLEDRCFAIEPESTDAFDEDKDPKNQTVASMKPPALIVQKTKTNEWLVLQEGSLELKHEDLQALGRAIEHNHSQAI